MEKRENTLEMQIECVAEKFQKIAKTKEIKVISHFDTDGITSAAIITRAFKKNDLNFSVQILKSLEGEYIHTLPKDKIILFLDLASGSLNHIANSELENVFIIDHHEIIQNIPENVEIINPQLHDKENLCAAALCYLFAKKLDKTNTELLKLAVLGMVGDIMNKNIDRLGNEILNNDDIKKKRGPPIFPSTRPLNRSLEYSSNPFIPGVTGNIKGVLEFLRETGLSPEKGEKHKSLMELNDEEMERLVTGIILRRPELKNDEILGDIYLIKFFNQLEDARELSAKINACSRAGEPAIALRLALENIKVKKQAEAIHVKHKQTILSGLKFMQETDEKIEGKGFVVVNAKDQIKETVIGTIASIISNSRLYEVGTVITTMAHYEDKIKVSCRLVGDTGKNLRELLANIVDQTGGEVGGHEFAAGCNIPQEKEQEFIDLLKKNFEEDAPEIIQEQSPNL